MKYQLIFLIISCLWFPAYGQNVICVEPFQAYDTITETGNFIKYHITNNIAQLEYGNSDFSKFYPEEFDCNIADAWVPKLKYENRNFIMLEYGCGSSCWGIKVLPLNHKELIRDIMYNLAYDDETTTLVYTDNDNLLIENLITKKIKTVTLPECQAANILYCLDSISINKSELKYQFYGPHRIDDKPTVVNYTVQLK